MSESIPSSDKPTDPRLVAPAADPLEASVWIAHLQALGIEAWTAPADEPGGLLQTLGRLLGKGRGVYLFTTPENRDRALAELRRRRFVM